MLADPELEVVVTVDGKEVKSNRLVLAESPVFNVTLPEDNIFGVPAGEYGPAVASALWVTLPPLPPGEHTVHFEVSAPNVGFSQDNTYILTVVNPSKAS